MKLTENVNKVIYIVPIYAIFIKDNKLINNILLIINIIIIY